MCSEGFVGVLFICEVVLLEENKIDDIFFREVYLKIWDVGGI